MISPSPVPPMPDAPPRIEVVDLDMAYGGFVVQRNLRFTVRPAEIFVVMGGSGSGHEGVSFRLCCQHNA